MRIHVKYDAMLWPHHKDNITTPPQRSMKLSKVLADNTHIANVIQPCTECTTYYNQAIYHPVLPRSFDDAVDFLTGKETTDKSRWPGAYVKHGWTS